MPKKKENLSPEERLIKAVIPKEEEPYKLPDNWVWTRLGDITEINPKKKVLDFAEDEEMSFVPMKSVSEETGRIEKIEYEKYSKLKKGYTQFIEEDVLFAKITPCMENGKCAIAENLKNNIGYGTTEFHVLRCSQGVINRLLHKFLRQESFRKKAQYNMTGSVGFRRVPVDFLKNTLFPLSPLNEQKRIVEKLDSLFEKTGKIKEIIEEVKEKTSLRREAVLSKAFTGELTEKWRAENKTENAKELLLKIKEEKLKNNPKTKIKDVSEMLVNEDEIPYKIPENWAWTRLGDIVDVKGGKRVPKGEEFSKIKTENIYLRVTDFKNRGIDLENLKYISDEVAEKIKNYRITSKDIYLSIAGTIGKVGIIPKKIENSFLTENACKLTNINNIEQKFLLNLLESSLIRKEIKNSITSSGQPKLAIFRIENFPISLPPLEEQKEIVRILDKVFEEENKISELISLEEKVEILEKTILDKAFRGELGTGNIDDEPAIELLKRALEENK